MLVLFGSFIILMVLSVPIAFALGISSILTVMVTAKVPLNFIAQGMFTTVDSYSLMAVPLFIFAGLIMVRVKCLWENIYPLFGVEVVRLQHQRGGQQAKRGS